MPSRRVRCAAPPMPTRSVPTSPRASESRRGFSRVPKRRRSRFSARRRSARPTAMLPCSTSVAGSSELAVDAPPRARASGVVAQTFSCEVGAVRLSERHPALLGAEPLAEPVRFALESQARADAAAVIAPFSQVREVRDLIVVGGTAFTAAAMVANGMRDGTRITRADCGALIDALLATRPGRTQTLTPHPPAARRHFAGRAHRDRRSVSAAGRARVHRQRSRSAAGLSELAALSRHRARTGRAVAPPSAPKRAGDDGEIGRHSRLEDLSRLKGNVSRDALKVGELVAMNSHDNAEPSRRKRRKV